MTDATFKVGDKVEHRSWGAGEIAYGPYRHARGEGKYLMKNAEGEHYYVLAEALTAIPAFAIGDTVTYEYGAGGKLVAGPFKSEYLDEPFWVVETAAGFHFSPTQSSLTKAEAVDDAIKVGDRVRVVRARHAEELHGEIGTVTSVTGTWTPLDDVLHPYSVRLDNGGEIEVAEVEKLSDAPTLPPGYDHAGKRYEYGAEYRDIDGDRWFFEAGRDGMPVSARRSYLPGRTLESVVLMHGPINKV